MLVVVMLAVEMAAVPGVEVLTEGLFVEMMVVGVSVRDCVDKTGRLSGA